MKGQNLKGDLPVTDLPFMFILNGTGLETPPTPRPPTARHLLLEMSENSRNWQLQSSQCFTS